MARRRARRQYGLGTIVQRGQRWRATYTRGTKRTTKSFATQELADRWLKRQALATELERAGESPDPRNVPTFEELVPTWLAARKNTHRSADEDRKRWRRHLAPTLHAVRPDDVDIGTLRRLILTKLEEGLSSSSVRLLIRLLSTLYSDLVEDGHATRNPVKDLPRKTRWLIRPAHDPRTTPFIERQEDIGRVFAGLPAPINIAYALGALAGLRTGECLSLRWPHVDIERRRIQVAEGLEGPTKSGKSRIVPILDALYPILTEWRARATDLTGRVVPPLRAEGEHLAPHTLGTAFAAALAPLGLSLTFYQATRHTFASHWVMQGGTLEMLKEILGHASITTTERYAHLRPEMFNAAAYARLSMLDSQDETENNSKSTPVEMRGLFGKVKEAAVN